MEAAERLFTGALALAAHSPDALIGLADAQDAAGNTEEAERTAYLMMSDFENAADAFSRSLALEPRRASYSNTGTVSYYLGRYDQAADMHRKAIEFAPADHRRQGRCAA
ncbi:MAG: tetratricopeptide repeat protein [Steroidobacteraceae bacterium]